MDYLFSLIEIPRWYFLIAFGIVILLAITTKKLTISLLVGYMFLVLAVTVLIRPVGRLSYELLPFWSYRDYFNGTDTSLMRQIIANVIMFIPIGIFSRNLLNWNGIWVGVFFSAFIELTQLITHRGLFEFDDIFHNTIGTAVGLALFMVLRMIWRCR